MQIRIFLVFIFLVFLIGFGCATTENKTSSTLPKTEEETFVGTKLAATANVRFSDVPVPVGFKLIQDKSFVFQTEETRVALLKYEGRAKSQDLIEFFKAQMLLYNWELLNVIEYERSVLNFERAGQSCIVTIESKGRQSYITISLAPKSKKIDRQSQETKTLKNK